LTYPSLYDKIRKTNCSNRQRDNYIIEGDKLHTDFVNLTAENITREHLCCIIRSKKLHPGIEAKRQWLSQRLKEGHVFRKLDIKGCVFIEYSPLETAWVPILGENYYYIYCLWVTGAPKGNGYGKALMEYCLADARQKGKSGVCMLGAKKQKAWLSDQLFAKKFGFEVVDTTNSGYELLALSFDGTIPKFAPNAKKEKIENKELTIYYNMQCPYVSQRIDMIKQYCEMNEVSVSFCQVDTLQKSKELPCVFNNWGVFYKGDFQTVNLLDISSLERILKK
jgi:ribosomal protein S18 acetylase RimI-like enzyme